MRMRILFGLAVMMLSSLGAIPHAAGQSQLSRLTDKMREADGASRFAESERYAREIVAIGKRIKDPKVSMVGSYYLARARAGQESFGDAEQWFLTAIQLSREHHPSYEAGVLGELAVVYANQGRHQDAERTYLRVIEVKEKQLGPNHYDVTKPLMNLANLYLTLQRYDEAESLLARAQTIVEQQTQPHQERLGQLLYTMGIIRYNQHRYVEAEQLYLRSRGILERLHGRQHPSIGATLGALGLLYQVVGRDSDVENVLRQSLDITKQAYGQRHSATARAQNILSHFYTNQGAVCRGGGIVPQGAGDESSGLWRRSSASCRIAGSGRLGYAGPGTARGGTAVFGRCPEDFSRYVRPSGPPHFSRPQIEGVFARKVGIVQSQRKGAEAGASRPR